MTYAFAYDYEADKAAARPDLPLQGLGPGAADARRPAARRLRPPRYTGSRSSSGRVTSASPSMRRLRPERVIEFVSSVDEVIGASLDPDDAIKPVAILFSRIDAGMADSPRPSRAGILST